MLFVKIVINFFLPYLDTIRDFIYLFLGLSISAFFWNSSEKYFKKGLKVIDPVWLLLMAIWGASGYFFLSFIFHFLGFISHFLGFVLPHFLLVVFDTLLAFFFSAVPDWDLLIYMLAQQLRLPLSLTILNYFFNSAIIPIAFIVIGIFIIPRLRNSSKDKAYKHLQAQMWSIGIGLSLGFSAHFLGDVAVSILGLFIRWGDAELEVCAFPCQGTSFLWFLVNILICFVMPYLFVGLITRSQRKKLRGQF